MSKKVKPVDEQIKEIDKKLANPSLDSMERSGLELTRAALLSQHTVAYREEGELKYSNDPDLLA